ncbi:hypothetical protein CBR_g39553 [Chara braunii]|uniref:Uncharacterized protein n=1 Tax=Chara braunii TaxID=69332 RepID=A0A388LS56_CHABU|nr:hypothetical protein CBR_g39553 [Chara braunii]|eukprot:GBG85091.1 hypothetical protein CBR_g39553 [Chara braunii]
MLSATCCSVFMSSTLTGCGKNYDLCGVRRDQVAMWIFKVSCSVVRRGNSIRCDVSPLTILSYDGCSLLLCWIYIKEIQTSMERRFHSRNGEEICGC